MIAHLVRNINFKRPRCRGVSVTLWCANGHHILDNILYHQLARWARYRHPRKSGKWCYHRYGRMITGRARFSDGESVLSFHQTTAVSRFVKVQGDKSPGACPERGRRDGDWVYWSTRLGRDPSRPRRVTRLLKKQRGCCAFCGLRFTTDDVIEMHHHDENHTNNAFITIASAAAVFATNHSQPELNLLKTRR